MHNSSYDTLEHTLRVSEYISKLIKHLHMRSRHHDDSKLNSPEKVYYDTFNPKLSKAEYGRDEYKALLEKMKPCLEHHYSVNRHHPEYFKNGVDGMTLIDLVEMLCDWKAAADRNGSKVNMDINKTRFNLSDQLCSILKNTLDELQEVK